MLKYLFVIALVTAAASAEAGVYKCQGPNGKTQFSDLPCKTGEQSAIVPDRAPITAQMRNDAQQRAAQTRDEAAASDRHGEPAAPPLRPPPRQTHRRHRRRSTKTRRPTACATSSDSLRRKISRRK